MRGSSPGIVFVSAARALRVLVLEPLHVASFEASTTLDEPFAPHKVCLPYERWS